MDKKELSERDICTKFITPAIVAAGWDIMKQVREEYYLNDGRIIVQGKMHTRGGRKFVDYLLSIKPNIPIAIIEAKDNKHAVGAGMRQALEYAEILECAKMLDVPFIFTSNGNSFVFHDKTLLSGKLETEIKLQDFPSPDKLWGMYLKHKGLEEREELEIMEQDYPVQDPKKTPRYYQRNAINRTLEAIAKGQDRLLLVMATGTGKTFTAYNIVWRLLKARVKKRVLFLADRNALLTQTKTGDFSPFGNDIMHIIKQRKIDKSYQIYFALYQGLTGSEDFQNVYKEFSPDFFDLVIIDECHRGSASEASAWRDVLEYFKPATQLGLTATPKETKDVSNIDYFGEPVYTYSLKQGIADGFLAPYKVIRVSTSIDEGWRPTKGLVDKYGNEVADRIYNLKDYDRELAIDERTQLVAQRITEYLKAYDRYAKTIVFCVDIDHAQRMRQALINENADLAAVHNNYIVKITGDDEQGKRELDNFMDVEERFPVIATTSKMLTTGVDTKMVKLIVLDASIESMTEFKQIIGRGTRVRTAEGKTWFTIMDFRKATNKFADPKFDGKPESVYEPGPGQPIIHDVPDPKPDDIIDEPEKLRKYYVDDQEVSITHERVQYYGPDGKLITESLKDYSKKTIRKTYRSLDDFLQQWQDADKKRELVHALAEEGVLLEDLREYVGENTNMGGKDIDIFDLVCHIAYDQPPLTRKERANAVRKRDYFTKYGDLARKVIASLLEKYEDEGIAAIESTAVLKVYPLNQLGSATEIVRAFGGKNDFEAALKELQRTLYDIA